MKNRKLCTVATLILVASQLGISVTAIADTRSNDQNEIKITSNIAELSDIEELSELMKPKELNAETRASTIEASVPRVWLPLGSPKETVSKIVGDEATVKLDGNVADRDQFIVEQMDSSISADRVGAQGWPVIMGFRDKSSSAHTTEQVDYSVNFGNSIVFESNHFNSALNQGNTAGAYTLHTDGYSPKITARSGKGSTSDVIHPDYPGEDYYRLDLFRKPKDAESIIINDDTEPEQYISGEGDDSKATGFRHWDENNVQYGDIIRAWSAKPGANNLYTSYKGNNPTIKNFADDEGFAYYEVTQRGYVPLSAIFLEVQEREIPVNISEEDLDWDIEESFVNVPDDVELEFVEYPDRDEPGHSTGKIKATKELAGNGQEIEEIYEVPFNVVEEETEEELKVYLHWMEIPVGTRVESLDAKDFVREVLRNGEEVDPDEYSAEFTNDLKTNRVGEEDVHIKVTLEEDDSIVGFDEWAFEVMWGNTITSYFNPAIRPDKPVEASISLLDDDGRPFLSSNEGHDLADDVDIWSATILDIYSENDIDSPKYTSDFKPLSQTTDELMRKRQKEFESYDELEYGDVLSYHTYLEGNLDKNQKGANTYVSRDEELVKEAEGYDKAYYELTEDGFHLLHLNQLSVSKKIPAFDVGTSHKDMNKKASESMDIPSHISNEDKKKLRFEYDSVDTKTPGIKETQMNVYEELETGGEFKTTYEVTYEVKAVVDTTLKVELQPVTVPVGTKKELLNPNDYVKSVHVGEKELSSSEYKVSFEKELNTQKVSEQETTIKIELTADGRTETNATKTNIIWGHSMVTKSSDDKIDTSISLLNNKNKPYLVANEGTGFSSGNLSSRPFIYAYRGDTETPLIDEKTESGYASVVQPAVKTMEKWNKVFEKKDFQYGDVFAYEVNDLKSETTSLKGKNTWTTRDEKLIKETEGYERSYYELTKEGYHLLQLNQLSVNEKMPVFDVGTGSVEMNSKAGEALIIPEHIKDKDKFRFEYASVDTVEPGIKDGKVNVYEKLKTGDEFKTTYDVKYEVKVPIDTTLKVEIQPVTIPVGTKSELVDLNAYVKSVYVGEEQLTPTDYKVSVEGGLNTQKVGEIDTSIKVELNADKRTDTQATKTNVIWQHSIATKSSDDKIDASISLLNTKDKPYLTANEGTGFSTNNLSTRPYIYAYRGNTETPLIDEKTESGYSSINSSASKTMDKWNNVLEKKDFQYGDVFGYKVHKLSNGDINEMGSNTWTAKNEKLVKETEGYDKALYEMTKDGYHLLQLNQLTVNKQIPVFDVGTSHEEMNKRAEQAMVIPEHIKDKEKFRFEYESEDTKTPGIKTTKLNVYEKLKTDGEFKTTYDVKYEVKVPIDTTLKVELQPVTIPVGTKNELIDLNDYIKAVYVGEQQLTSEDYKVSLESDLNTKKISTQDTTIKVELNSDKRTETQATKTTIIWGQSVATKSTDGNIDASVSLLDNKGKPYLAANEGTGFSTNNLSTRPYIYAYRGNTETPLINEKTESGYSSTTASASKTMEKWNTVFETKDFQYGDVFGYKVHKLSNGDINEMGSNTWTAKNEKLVKETEGYERAYYEMTPTGYRLLQLNQLEVNPKLLSVNIGTSKEEMDKQAAETMIIPKSIKNPKDYRFEFASVDTKKSGKKKTKMNVYEKLSNGTEFRTTYDVEYNVNPQVTEQYVNDSGKVLKTEEKTNFVLGTSYQGNPDNFMTVSGETYAYKGWLPAGKKPSKDKPTPGKPEPTQATVTYQYVYTKESKMINVTMPTEMIFGTEAKSSDIYSEKGEIKNNSAEVSTAVVMDGMVKEKSDLTLLKEKDKDPSKVETAARLNLMIDEKIAINSLTEATESETVSVLAPSQQTTIGLSGKYFGDLTKNERADYQMRFKFRVESKD